MDLAARGDEIARAGSVRPRCAEAAVPAARERGEEHANGYCPP